MKNYRKWMLTAVFSVAALSLAGAAIAQTTRPAGSDDLRPAQPRVEQAPGNAAPAPANASGNQGAAQNAPANQPGKPGGQDPFGNMWLWVVLIGGMFFLYWWSSRSRRKQEQKRREMLSSLKKGDKVTSIGGIIGSVVEVRDDEVTIKVDETNNVRMKFARWAIRGVGEEAKTQGPDDKK